MHVCVWRCSGEYLLSESRGICRFATVQMLKRYQLQFRLNVVRILWVFTESCFVFLGFFKCSLRESSLAETNYPETHDYATFKRSLNRRSPGASVLLWSVPASTGSSEPRSRAFARARSSRNPRRIHGLQCEVRAEFCKRRTREGLKRG